MRSRRRLRRRLSGVGREPSRGGSAGNTAGIGEDAIGAGGKGRSQSGVVKRLAELVAFGLTLGGERAVEFSVGEFACPFLRYLLSFAKTPIFSKTLKLPSPNQNLQHTFVRGRERSGGYPVALTPPHDCADKPSNLSQAVLVDESRR